MQLSGAGAAFLTTSQPVHSEGGSFVSKPADSYESMTAAELPFGVWRLWAYKPALQPWRN